MPQELIIQPVLNGFIVRAGCQTLVYDNPEKIKMDFAEWVNDPEKIERRYRELMEKKGIYPLAPPPCNAAQEAHPMTSVASLRQRDDLARDVRR